MRLIKQSNGLEFFYDDSGVIGFKYGGKLYTYLKDIQGNIIGIVNNTNALIARYVYDAWGNFTVYDGTGKAVGTSETVYSSTTAIWNLNPFRYRGYYYDIETGLYYLLNRYYDPQTGRFLSLDNSSYADPETINGLNLYLYCNNNPVMYVDPTGEFLVFSILLGAAVGGIFAGINAYNDNLDFGHIVLASIGGAIMGAATALAFNLGGLAFLSGNAAVALTYYGISIYSTMLVSAINYSLQSVAYSKEITMEGLLRSTLSGFVEANISFFAGTLAGRFGFFKYAYKSKNMVDGLIRKPVESLFRSLYFSLPSVGIRSIFNYFYD